MEKAIVEAGCSACGSGSGWPGSTRTRRTSPDREVDSGTLRLQPLGTKEVEPAEYDEAARIVTDALLDDPGWRAVGPDRTGHRRRVALRYHRAAIRVVHRYGRPIYGAYRDGALVGVAVTFAAGRYPPPAWTFLEYVPGFLLAGPGPVVRGLRTSSIQDRGHPREEHVFLWFLAVDPPHQRGGVGRALLERVFAAAEAPVFLDTANPANVPYYAGFGFEEIGRAPLPRGATMWHMLREHPAEPGASGL